MLLKVTISPERQSERIAMIARVGRLDLEGSVCNMAGLSQLATTPNSSLENMKRFVQVASVC